MGVILAILAASALIRAEPANHPGGWSSDADYPADAEKRMEEGPVGFLLLITPEGQVAQCNVSQSSGFSELDKQTCAVIRARAKFKPARDENGTPVYDRYKGHIYWHHPTKGGSSRHQVPQEFEPDMMLQVQKLPNGDQEAVASITTRIDAFGRVAYCEGNPRPKSLPKLVEVACSQMKSDYLSDVRDEMGRFIPMIRSFRIAFRTAPN